LPNFRCLRPWGLPIKTLLRNGQKQARQGPGPSKALTRASGGSGGAPRPLKGETGTNEKQEKHPAPNKTSQTKQHRPPGRNAPQSNGQTREKWPAKEMCKKYENAACLRPWGLPIKTQIRNVKKTGPAGPGALQGPKRSHAGSGGAPRPLKGEGWRQHNTEAYTNLLRQVTIRG
jgi:hypothetical protein